MKNKCSFLVSATAAIVLSPMMVLGAGGEEDFRNWLDGIRVEAVLAGVDENILDSVLESVELLPRVIELDRNQPESRISFEAYLSKVVPESRISAARKRTLKHSSILNAVELDYQVQTRFILSLWGIESDFGRFTGGFSVINSLSTLAYDGRRSTYFRAELIDALKILNLGEVNNSQMTGSWAGAMGQCQFMPSSYHRFAEDYDNDGKRDIWKNLPDTFASMANYLHKSGWKYDQTWGREVVLPKNFDLTLAGLEYAKSITQWQELGVRRVDGRDLPTRDLPAAIILPDGAGTKAYMVYDNFRNIMKWNRSTYFALAVGILSDHLLQ